MNEDRIPFRDALARAAVPLAALAAMAAFAEREVDPVAAAETSFLAFLAAAGLLAVAFLAPRPAWEAGLGATLAVTIVWALPPGPGRGAAVALVLLGALAVASGRSFESLKSFGSLLPLALGLQVLLRGSELLFQPQLNLRLLVVLLALPVAGAVATAVLARRHGPAALVAAGAVLLLAPGWNVAATAGLAAVAAGDWIGRWWGAALAAVAVAGAFLLMPGAPDLSMAAGPLALTMLYLGRRTLAFPAVATASLLAAAALLASYPWLRAEPLREAFSAAFRIPTPGVSLLPPGMTVVVDSGYPAWTAPVKERSLETVVLETSLSNGAKLVNGTRVATVWLRGADGRSAFWTVRAGAETGEWAARRPDVVAEAVLRSPPPWISYVAGDFFGQRYRSLWTVEAPGPFTTLSIERNPELPPEVSLAIHLLEVRP